MASLQGAISNFISAMHYSEYGAITSALLVSTQMLRLIRADCNAATVDAESAYSGKTLSRFTNGQRG